MTIPPDDNYNYWGIHRFTASDSTDDIGNFWDDFARTVDDLIDILGFPGIPPIPIPPKPPNPELHRCNTCEYLDDCDVLEGEPCGRDD
jgi:hypothetical protein